MVFGGANTTANNGDQQLKWMNTEMADGSETRPQDEHLQLNESTLWQGSRADKLNPQGHEGFVEARKLLLESQGTDGAKIAQAEKVLEDKMLSTPRGMPGYSTLGDLYIRMRGENRVSNYKRQPRADDLLDEPNEPWIRVAVLVYDRYELPQVVDFSILNEADTMILLTVHQFETLLAPREACSEFSILDSMMDSKADVECKSLILKALSSRG